MRFQRAIAGVAIVTVASAAPAVSAARRDAVGGNRHTVKGSSINARALFHNTRDLMYRSPFGAVPAGKTVRLRLRTARTGVTSVTLHTQEITAAGAASSTGNQKLKLVRRDRKFDTWQTMFTPKDIVVYTYEFLVKNGKAKEWYGDTAAANGGIGQAYKHTPDEPFHITSYAPTFQAVSWAKDMVIYQIFPDRFFNGDPSNDRTVAKSVYGSPPSFETSENAVPLGVSDFFGGDLQGVIDKLPYLKRLGVNTLYLNPIFLAPSSHKYDTSDYFKIDPHFGTMQTFITLVKDAHADGMHLILDGVFNHTSSDSIYFNEYNHFPDVGAYQSKNSQYYPWYHFSSWPDVFDSFDVLSQLPTLQEVDPVKDFIFRKPDSVAQYWPAQGADGWRLDAATDKSHQWWQEFRSAVKARFPDDILICECDLAPIDAVNYLLGNELDGDMNYRFRDYVLGFFAHGGGSSFGTPISVRAFFNDLEGMIEEYPLPALYSSMNLVGSHDTSRILTELGGNKQALKMVATFQATWLGAPTIYYGDEAGLQDAPSPDPFYVSRNFFPWSHPDTSLQGYYTTILAIRAADPALRDGTVSPLVLDNNNRVLAFLRKDSRQSVAVAINDDPLKHTVRLTLKGLASGTKVADQLSGKRYTVSHGKLTLSLSGYTAAVLAQTHAP